MTVVMSGGGSGGHITPILAVSSELKKLDPSTRIIYIGQRGDSLADVPAADTNIDEVYTVPAGKFRRYHGGGLKQIFDVKTGLLNARDASRVLRGYFASRRLLRKLKPDIVFIKGGFVGVPIGLAAGHLKIPYITHDSDAIPGLANRIIAGKAKLHAVALPKEVYKYPAAKTATVGVPVADKFLPVTREIKEKYQQELGLVPGEKLLFVIGGGLGAQRVNMAVARAAKGWLDEFSNLKIIHVTGRGNFELMQKIYEETLYPAERGRVELKDFLNDVYRYSAAADVILTRAGATNLAEFAVQGKACVVVPNPELTGGHQLKNADYLAGENAVEVVSETDLKSNSTILSKTVSELLNNPQRQAELGRNFQRFGHSKSAQELADLILKQIKS